LGSKEDKNASEADADVCFNIEAKRHWEVSSSYSYFKLTCVVCCDVQKSNIYIYMDICCSCVLFVLHCLYITVYHGYGILVCI